MFVKAATSQPVLAVSAEGHLTSLSIWSKMKTSLADRCCSLRGPSAGGRLLWINSGRGLTTQRSSTSPWSLKKDLLQQAVSSLEESSCPTCKWRNSRENLKTKWISPSRFRPQNFRSSHNINNYSNKPEKKLLPIARETNCKSTKKSTGLQDSNTLT